MNRLTKQEAAVLLKISIPTLNRRIKARKIEYSKDGRLVMFERSEIEKYDKSIKIKTA